MTDTHSSRCFLLLISVVVIVVGFAGCSSISRSSVDGLNDGFNVDDWQRYVGSGTGVWVSIDQQKVFLINDKQVVKRYRCSTAGAGAGNLRDSGKTPLGWHRVGEKIGNALPAGAILKDRQWTGQVWTAGQAVDKDLILSRILWLDGLEPGKNHGGEVDTRSRYIYIHGTNQIDELGRPASAGCIRMDPEEVIDLYEQVEEGCGVLITR